MKDCCDSCKEGSECCSVNEAQSAYDMMDRGSEILFTKGKMLITKKGVNLFHGRMWSSVNPNGQNVRLKILLGENWRYHPLCLSNRNPILTGTIFFDVLSNQ